MMVMVMVSGKTRTVAPDTGFTRAMENVSSGSSSVSSAMEIGIFRVPFDVNVRLDGPAMKSRHTFWEERVHNAISNYVGVAVKKDIRASA